jgi:Ca2+-transporting ATPase
MRFFINTEGTIMDDYTSNLSSLTATLGSNAKTGLSQARAEELLAAVGENKLEGKKQKSLLVKFLLQMKDVMVIILILAAVVSFIVALLEQNGEYIDSVIILAIVVLNGILGVSQESKAEKALEALQDMSAPVAKVLRDGAVAQLPTAQLVPGDVVLLESGDFIPADGRLIESASLKCVESALTGESVPVEKDANAVVEPNAPIGDRLNMVFSGCAVTYGRGVVLITGTGMKTEMGKIAGLLGSGGSETTPLQQKLSQLGKYLGILALGICAVIFGLGLYRGMEPMHMFMTAVSLAVAAIPEGLTAVVTVVLAMGVQKMVKKNAIIRRLPAVETLGSASVICSDKTGTLTQNRMTVMKVWAGGPIADAGEPFSDRLLQVIRLASLCNDGRIETGEGGEERHVGDPTETAIIVTAKKNGLEKSALETDYPRVAEIPFDSDRKLMTTVNLVGGKPLAIVKGGFDVLLPLCTNVDQAKIESINRAMAADALRVLAVACKELDAIPANPTTAELEANLTFIGLIGMIDPPRKESGEAIALCHSAGIKTVMITGDHVLTASAIAKELGIIGENGEGQAISGAELREMDQIELERVVDQYRVYARVSPEDKIRIVQAWQFRGDVVAMTGDGVNDAPALRAADIGCAMGITGTDVAKGAADMVLTDDNFSTIVEAVKGGRGIYDNIKKTVQFLLGSNLGEILVVFVAMLLGWGSPLLAIHLLLVNIVTDALPALALGVEPTEDRVMSRKPVPRSQSIFAGGLGLVIILQGAMIGILTLIAYYIGSFVGVSALILPSHELGSTMAFLVLALSQLVQAMNCRSDRSLFSVGFASNPQMLLAALGSAAVVAAICLIPPIEEVFRLVNLSGAHWIIVGVLTIAPLVIVEIGKLIVWLAKRKTSIS